MLYLILSCLVFSLSDIQTWTMKHLISLRKIPKTKKTHKFFFHTTLKNICYFFYYYSTYLNHCLIKAYNVWPQKGDNSRHKPFLWANKQHNLLIFQTILLASELAMFSVQIWTPKGGITLNVKQNICTMGLFAFKIVQFFTIEYDRK